LDTIDYSSIVGESQRRLREYGLPH
jgi:hypothetical protein